MLQRLHRLHFQEGQNLACPANDLKFQTLEMHRHQTDGHRRAPAAGGTPPGEFKDKLDNELYFNRL
jgi:hypothetical protein